MSPSEKRKQKKKRKKALRIRARKLFNLAYKIGLTLMLSSNEPKLYWFQRHGTFEHIRIGSLRQAERYIEACYKMKAFL